jgi:hypothetical protein
LQPAHCQGQLDQGDVFAPPGEVTGTVWLYRVAPRSTPGVWQDVFIDGQPRARVAPGVTRGRLSAQQHVVDVMTHKVRVVLPRDGHVFDRIDVDGRLFGGGLYPVLVDEPKARAELKMLGVDPDAP